MEGENSDAACDLKGLQGFCSIIVARHPSAYTHSNI